MKGIKSLIFIIVTLFSSFLPMLSIAQFGDVNFKPEVMNYYENLNKAIIFDLNNGEDSAIHYSLKAFTYMKPFSEDLFITSYYYHKKGDLKNAVQYYYKAVQSGYLPINEDYAPYFMVENDTIKEYKAVLKQLDSLKYYPAFRIDFAFSNLLAKIFAKDQLVRVSHRFFEQDSLTRQDSKRLEQAYFQQIDKENISELLQYIDKNGMPHYNSITAAGQEALSILMRHYIPLIDSPLNAAFYQKIKAAIENGILPNTKIRMAMDYCYIQITNSSYQYFGTFTAKNKDGKREVAPPIYSIELVDTRRKEWMYLPLDISMKMAYGDQVVLPNGYLKKSVNPR